MIIISYLYSHSVENAMCLQRLIIMCQNEYGTGIGESV